MSDKVFIRVQKASVIVALLSGIVGIILTILKIVQIVGSLINNM